MNAVLTPTHPGPRAGGRAAGRTAARGPSPLTLLRVELRKSVDTRAGWMLLAGMALLGLLAVGWSLTHPDGEATLDGYVDAATVGVQLVVPVLGVLAMTSEWTQRTALTTFTLVPRRGRVLAAKVGAAVLLGAATAAATTALAALALPVHDLVHDGPVVWGPVARIAGGAVVAAVLVVVMGSAFGALLPNSAAAITAYYVAPTAWTVLAGEVLQDVAPWFDVFGALERIAGFDLDGQLPQTLTALGTWIVLPLAVGTVRSLRRGVS
jgi:hypothetical protein